MLKVYAYKNCGTCKKALKWLDSNNVKYTEVPIRETPPTKPELKSMLKLYGGDLRKLFNTSGMDYRELGLRHTLPDMTQEQALALLAKTGNLVKRPFELNQTGTRGVVGFKEEEWRVFL